MERDAKRTMLDPWYKRAIAAFIGVGAVASAFVAINQAKDEVIEPEPDFETAAITHIELVRPATLPEFVADHGKRVQTLTPAGSAIGRYDDAGLTPVAARVQTIEPADPTDPADPTTTLSPTRATDHTPTPPPRSSSSPSASPSSSPTADAAGAAQGLVARMIRTRPELTSVGDPEQLEVVVPIIVDGDVDPGRRSSDDGAEQGGGDPSGDVTELSTEEVAERTLAAVKQVETKLVGGRDRLNGFIVQVKFTVKGFKNQSLLLTWSLDSQKSTVRWRAKRLGKQLTATTNEDGGVTYIWIPNLIRPDTYKLWVYLSRGKHELDSLSAVVTDD